MSENIIKSYQYNDLISFKIECDCCEHDLVVILDGNDENGDISLIFRDHSLIKSDEYNLTFFEKIWVRIKKAFAILFFGIYSNDYTFIFKGKEQLNEFVEYLSIQKNKIIANIKNEKENSKE